MSYGFDISEMTMALIDAAYDKESVVQESVADALFDLGRNKTALVLSSCFSYLKKHSKVCHQCCKFIHLLIVCMPLLT